MPVAILRLIAITKPRELTLRPPMQPALLNFYAINPRSATTRLSNANTNSHTEKPQDKGSTYRILEKILEIGNADVQCM